jgi:hypothetical protein
MHRSCAKQLANRAAAWHNFIQSFTKDFAMAHRMTSFAEFWPYYLREHALPQTRFLHYIGTSLLIAIGAYALISGHYIYAALMPLAGYGFAWGAHFFVEHNRPATFTYPVWSLISDFKMYGCWVSGRLGPHLAAAGVTPAH